MNLLSVKGSDILLCVLFVEQMAMVFWHGARRRFARVNPHDETQSQRSALFHPGYANHTERGIVRTPNLRSAIAPIYTWGTIHAGRTKSPCRRAEPWPHSLYAVGEFLFGQITKAIPAELPENGKTEKNLRAPCLTHRLAPCTWNALHL